MRDLTFRPSNFIRAAYAVLFFMLALMLAAELKDLPPRGLHDWLVIALALLCLYAAITYPLRAMVFTAGAIRVRSLGRRRTIRLPAKVRVTPGLTFGSRYLIDDATRKVVLVLKREFGPVESVEARIESWLRSENRLAEEPRPDAKG